MSLLRGPLFVFFVVLATLSVLAFAQETTTTSKSRVLTTPTDTYCIQIVCPSADAVSTTDPPCPDRCKDNCNIIQNACCKNQVVAVCNDESSVPGAPAPSSTTQPANPSSAVSTPSFTASATSTPSASDSSAPAATSSNPADNAASCSNGGVNKQLLAAALGLPVFGFLLRA